MASDDHTQDLALPGQFSGKIHSFVDSQLSIRVSFTLWQIENCIWWLLDLLHFYLFRHLGLALLGHADQDSFSFSTSYHLSSDLLNSSYCSSILSGYLSSSFCLSTFTDTESFTASYSYALSLKYLCGTPSIIDSCKFLSLLSGAWKLDLMELD